MASVMVLNNDGNDNGFYGMDCSGYIAKCKQTTKRYRMKKENLELLEAVGSRRDAV